MNPVFFVASGDVEFVRCFRIRFAAEARNNAMVSREHPFIHMEYNISVRLIDHRDVGYCHIKLQEGSYFVSL